MTQQYPYPADRFSLVGRVTGSHGIRGELRIFPLHGTADDFSHYSRVALVAADGRMTGELDILRSRAHGKQVILKLETIETKNEADLTVAMGVLCLRRERRPDAPSADSAELIGCEVAAVGGTVIGTVSGLGRTAAHPLLIVEGDGEEFLIPLVDGIVVERGPRKIIVDPPIGLLEINRKEP